MWYTEETCSLADFISIISEKIGVTDVLHAMAIEENIPIYDSSALRNKSHILSFKQEFMKEFNSILLQGAGVFVLKNAYPDLTPVDQATKAFNEIIVDERDKAGGGDHFAKSGANDRIWNALEKLCLKSPAVFSQYYANGMIALASESWLGPGYQMTSQINVVRPGAAAQTPHCDYHLGFQTAKRASQYPSHVHHLSSALTLQGAIAHCDMPMESGPTKMLPYSQNYAAGYLAWRRDDFKDYFESHHIQMPLKKGDAIFFNPALFHAAGANKTNNIDRMANLLQISSAFGRAMECVDRTAMSSTLFPVLRAARQSGQMTRSEIFNVVASCAEGYSFPTNLDRHPPTGGLAPISQQEIMLKALEENQSAEQFALTVKSNAMSAARR
jgi:ectoine hydroxylase-related dioxygenase (phytanoyl-CoA dioxygenase family)